MTQKLNKVISEFGPHCKCIVGVHVCVVVVCIRASLCDYLCEEKQVLSDCEVIKQYVVLGTESQAAADQSHVLTDVVTVDVGPATGGRKKTCKHKHNYGLISNRCGIYSHLCENCFFLYPAHLSTWTASSSSQHHCVPAAPRSVLQTCSASDPPPLYASCCPLWIPIERTNPKPLYAHPERK